MRMYCLYMSATGMAAAHNAKYHIMMVQQYIIRAPLLSSLLCGRTHVCVLLTCTVVTNHWPKL